MGKLEYVYILEKEIRLAMSNTFSNMAAAKYLKVSPPTYKRAASRFIDKETGKTLYELHKNESGKGLLKPFGNYSLTTIERVLSGEQKKVDIRRFVKGLILNLMIEEKCSICDFNERKPDTFEIPLLLEFVDGDKNNFKRENLKLICPNCYSLKGGRVVASSPRGRPKSVVRNYIK